MERKYDLVVILDPQISAGEQEKLLVKIKKLVADEKGEVSGSKEWGKKELAYPILKNGLGVFVEMQLSLPSSQTPSFRQKLQAEEKILRYLLVVEGGHNVVKVIK